MRKIALRDYSVKIGRLEKHEIMKGEAELSYFCNPRVKTKPDSFPVVISPLVSLNNNRKRRTMKKTISSVSKESKLKSQILTKNGVKNSETKQEL